MKLKPQIRRKKSIRYKNFDYSQNGYYFVTICTKDKFCYFGNIKDVEINLSKLGEVAKECWLEIPKHYPNVELDRFVVMPNHVHGIIAIKPTVGNSHGCSLQRRQYQKLPIVIGSFKSSVK